MEFIGSKRVSSSVFLLLQVLRIYFLHFKVVHGDLAARNILVFPNSVVKVTDFGLARKLNKSGIYSKMSEVWIKVNFSLPFVNYKSEQRSKTFTITRFRLLYHGDGWLQSH